MLNNVARSHTSMVVYPARAVIFMMSFLVTVVLDRAVFSPV